MSQSLMSSHQPSLTEWFAAIGLGEKAAALREEDNMRHSRWETLYQLIGFPYDRPEIFEAFELKESPPAFQALLAKQGDFPAAIRLVAKREGLPKLRHRGPPLKECYEWFLKQDINPADYLAEVYRHHENKSWSTTFVVHPGGITGELIEGLHSQLTQGHTTHPLYEFNYDFTTWVWSDDPGEGEGILQHIIERIKVPERHIQNKINTELQVEFYNEFLGGYFEATTLDTGESFFIDYNRLLGQAVPAPFGAVSPASGPQTVHGIPACPGQATGRACVVNLESGDPVDFHDGDILICANTDVRYLPYMQRAGAIVTDQGSVLSHAAIVSRELNKPCIVNTQVATKVFKSGDLIEVNAGKGAIRKVENI